MVNSWEHMGPTGILTMIGKLERHMHPCKNDGHDAIDVGFKEDQSHIQVTITLL